MRPGRIAESALRTLPFAIAGGVLAAGVCAGAQPGPAGAQPLPPGVTCQADQPVYASDYRLAGTWHVLLRQGEHVTLPDGDQAVCQSGTLQLLGSDGTRN